MRCNTLNTKIFTKLHITARRNISKYTPWYNLLTGVCNFGRLKLLLFKCLKTGVHTSVFLYLRNKYIKLLSSLVLLWDKIVIRSNEKEDISKRGSGLHFKNLT